MNVLPAKILDALSIAITAARISNGKMNREMHVMKTRKECYSIQTFQYIDA
jgi:hypothetical protein